MYTYRGRVGRVVDGDTVDLDWWDLGAGVQLTPTDSQPLRMRFAGVNAYETSLRGDTTEAQKQLGLAAKAWLMREIEGRVVRLKTVKDGQRGSFGRYLVWLWKDGDDDEELPLSSSINQQIVDMGLGCAVRAIDKNPTRTPCVQGPGVV